MISFSVEGIPLALAKFAELETAAVGATKAGVEHSAESVLKVAEQLVPVDTGRLKESLRISHDETGAALVGSEGVPYAVFVEFGGAAPAQPFLRPAAEESNASVAVSQAVAAAIAAVAGL